MKESDTLTEVVKRKAIFLDKDGTLIPDIPYNVNPDLITISAATIRFLQEMQAAGYLLIIVSNQSGIAKGFFQEHELRQVWNRINELLMDYEVRIDSFYYCPHDSGSNLLTENILCSCHKPKPGMLLRAAGDFDIDLDGSWMIGDILNDVEAGNRAGCRTILLDNGNETEWLPGKYRQPYKVINDISDATGIIEQYQTHEPEKRQHTGSHQSAGR